MVLPGHDWTSVCMVGRNTPQVVVCPSRCIFSGAIYASLRLPGLCRFGRVPRGTISAWWDFFGLFVSVWFFVVVVVFVAVNSLINFSVVSSLKQGPLYYVANGINFGKLSFRNKFHPGF